MILNILPRVMWLILRMNSQLKTSKSQKIVRLANMSTFGKINVLQWRDHTRRLMAIGTRDRLSIIVLHKMTFGIEPSIFGMTNFVHRTEERVMQLTNGTFMLSDLW